MTFWDSEPNIFKLTGLRLYASTDVLFNRAAALGRGAAFDEQMSLLKAKFTIKHTTTSSQSRMRHLYLRFGPSTLLNCTFCTLDDDLSYTLHHLPTYVLLPHLLSLLTIGLATSESLCGFAAHRWRHLATTTALVLATTDLWLTVFSSEISAVDAHMPGPEGMFWILRMTRSLVLCGLQALLAGLIYVSSTNRLPFLISSAETDPKAVQQQRANLLGQAQFSLQAAQGKLHALNVARNAVNRDAELKGVDDAYWQRVKDVEGPNPVERIWADEDVQAAVARSLGEGRFDMEKTGRECEQFVAGMTRGLEDH
ncbi:MAG: hypothetical protein Q9227_002790 [Pyrenula ochraceoflavens]